MIGQKRYRAVSVTFGECEFGRREISFGPDLRVGTCVSAPEKSLSFRGVRTCGKQFWPHFIAEDAEPRLGLIRNAFPLSKPYLY